MGTACQRKDHQQQWDKHSSGHDQGNFLSSILSRGMKPRKCAKTMEE
jgi:hypothetical protein